MGILMDKVAIITGSGSGIGRGAAKVFAQEGAKVAVVDVDESGGEETVSQIKEQNGTAEFWSLDVTDEENVKDVFGEIKDKFGKIDILVNNAGASFDATNTVESTVENWEKVFNLNAKGPFLCSKHAIPYMQEIGGGSIINVSSLSAYTGDFEMAHYRSSKGAVISMTIQDAFHYASDNIRVNCVVPGVIKTESVEQYATDHPELGGIEGLEKIYSEPIPLKRLGTPEDLGNGMAFLASDKASFITGITLPIEGGQSIT